MSGRPCHPYLITYLLFALRLCGYNPNYLKNPAAASKVRSSSWFYSFFSHGHPPPSSLPHPPLPVPQGSQKLLHWTAQDVAGWLCSIDLDEYVGALQNRGLHGALMVRTCCPPSLPMGRAHMCLCMYKVLLLKVTLCGNMRVTRLYLVTWLTWWSSLP